MSYIETWSNGHGRVASLLTDVRRITIPEAGHFSALERPDVVARIPLTAS
ncbi:MAG: alpha/beta fold hydrolase [Candidatus Sericytochromatia bacterium]